MEGLFFVLLFLAAYSYFIYPVFLLVAARTSRRSPSANAGSPQSRLSLVITAHNEAARIREKIENSLLLDYPENLLEIIVASDASTDETDAIVAEYRDRNVILARANERKGKEHAQLQALKKASGSIIVFSDVATSIPPDGLIKLAGYFADPEVGAISSEDRFVSADGTLAGEGLYVRYEMWLRKLESRLGGLVGLSGSFFAARREVCLSGWDIEVPSDFNTALNCARQGLHSVSCPDVIGVYSNIKNESREYNRKIRTVIRGMTGLASQLQVLNPFVYGWFSFQVWSHKVMRWMVPWALLALLLVSGLLVGEGWVYQAAFAAQLLFYAIAAVGWRWAPARDYAVVRVIYYFVQANLAIAQASLRFFKGERMTVWAPSQR